MKTPRRRKARLASCRCASQTTRGASLLTVTPEVEGASVDSREGRVHRAREEFTMNDKPITGIDAWCVTCKSKTDEPHDEEIHRRHRDKQLSVFPGWVAPESRPVRAD